MGSLACPPPVYETGPQKPKLDNFQKRNNHHWFKKKKCLFKNNSTIFFYPFALNIFGAFLGPSKRGLANWASSNLKLGPRSGLAVAVTPEGLQYLTEMSGFSSVDVNHAGVLFLSCFCSQITTRKTCYLGNIQKMNSG